MILESLAAYFESLNLGAQGQSIFINMMPLECSQGILLRGEYSGMKYDYELLGFFKGRIRLITRSLTYQGAMTLINQVLTTLPTTEATIDTFDVRYLRPLTQPIGFPVTKGNYFEAFTDLEIAFS